VRALFYGLGRRRHGGRQQELHQDHRQRDANYAQGYFVYDSKKSGSMTTSHLRFGPNPIRSSYLITKASFVACHNFSFLEKMDVLEAAMPGAVFLLNSPYFGRRSLGQAAQDHAAADHRKKIEFYVIDGYTVAANRHGHAHQHHHADLLLRHQRRAAARRSHRADQEGHQEDLRQARRSVVQKNFAAVDAALAHLHKVKLPATASSTFRSDSVHPVPQGARVCAQRAGQIASPARRRSAAGQRHAGGRHLPHRHRAVGEAQHRAVIPVWDKDLCIQCGKCVLVCPHAVIRAKVYDAANWRKAPATFKWAKPKWKGMERTATRCRWRRKIAPAARSAWRSAR
jgi:pyruvate-ferredoxin/flavodoxin oxidoreductase